MYVLAMAHTFVAVRGQLFSSIILRITPLLSRKETAVARMVAANEVPEMVVADGAVGTLQT